MKNLYRILLPFFALILFSSKSPLPDNNTVVLVHHNYTTTYNKVLHYPVLVEWYDTKAKSQCDGSKLDRTNNFAPDPLLHDETNVGASYVHAGYDRGHMCPAASNECSGKEVISECFYFSNMIPQPHSLNAGDWKSLEVYCRNLSIQDDSIHVWAGGVGAEKVIGKLTVPTYCWKVIYDLKTKTTEAYIFRNDFEPQSGISAHKKTLQDVEQLIGFTINVK